MENLGKNKLTIKGANIVYLIAMVLLVVVGSIVQKWNLMYGMLITEFVLVAAPVIIYVKYRKGSLRQELRFKKLKGVYALLVIIIFVSGFFVGSFVNLIGMIILSTIGKIIPSPIPTATNLQQYAVLIAVIAGSAGICEELLFRGLLLRAYERLGMWGSIIVSSVLFGMLHLNVQNFLGPIFLGAILGFVVYKSDSIFAGMLGHFTNNALSLTFGFVAGKLSAYNPLNTENLTAGLTTSTLMATAVLWSIVALGAGLIMVFSMKALSDMSKDYGHTNESGTPHDTVRSLDFRSVVADPGTAWPLYIAAFIFVAMAVLELVYMSTGSSLIKQLFS